MPKVRALQFRKSKAHPKKRQLPVQAAHFCLQLFDSPAFRLQRDSEAVQVLLAHRNLVRVILHKDYSARPDRACGLGEIGEDTETRLPVTSFAINQSTTRKPPPRRAQGAINTQEEKAPGKKQTILADHPPILRPWLMEK